MVDRLFEPIPITYTGLFADDHLVDAQEFGRSVIGVSKIANNIANFLFFSITTHDPRSYHIRFFVGPSRENGHIQEIFAVLSTGQMPAFPQVLINLAKTFVERMFSAIIAQTLNKPSESQMALDKLHDLAVRHADFAAQVHAGDMQDKTWLRGMVEHFVTEHRSPLREIPEPVGRSVRQMQIGDSHEGPTIDEPSAEVLRSKESMQVGETVEYDVTIVGVFKTNGAARFRLLDQNRIVAGKIIDPALANPNNVYTRALNENARLHVIGKPVLKKDGQLHRLFVSDASLSR